MGSHHSGSEGPPLATGLVPCRLQASLASFITRCMAWRRPTLLTIASWLPLTSFATVYVQPMWTHASSRGPVPVLVTGVSPLPASGSGTAYRRMRRPDIELDEFRRLLKTFFGSSVCTQQWA